MKSVIRLLFLLLVVDVVMLSIGIYLKHMPSPAPKPSPVVDEAVHIKYYPEQIVFRTHSGNLGVTLDDPPQQLCSALFTLKFHECHDSVPTPRMQ